MRFMPVILSGVLLFGSTVVAHARHNGSAEQILGSSSAFSQFRWRISHSEQQSPNVAFSKESTWQPARRKSVPKAALFSAVLPGSGEFYTGSYIRGFAFLVIEAAALSGHFYYQNRGNDLEDAFRRYADTNWVENDYWNWMSMVSGIDRADLNALREYERQNFSHFLPENKNQQYYENIGKYNQFVAGWVDFDYRTYSLDSYLSGPDPDSPLREDYTLQRRDANDNFQKATNLVTLVIFNHVLSMFDAALTAKGFNKRQLQGRLRIQGKVFDQDVVPALNLGISW